MVRGGLAFSGSFTLAIRAAKGDRDELLGGLAGERAGFEVSLGLFDGSFGVFCYLLGAIATANAELNYLLAIDGFAGDRALIINGSFRFLIGSESDT
jgi:hypothetical protein